MAKYADIEPFYDWLVELMRMDTSDYPDHQTLMLYEILDELDSLPELVRCKDCKYQGRASCPTYYEDRRTYRDCWALDGDNDFCSDGVRREEE